MEHKELVKVKVVTTEKLDKFPPYTTTGDYIESKKEMQAITKFPNFGETAELDLVFERTTLLNREVELEAKRKEFIERRKELQAQWADIEEKELSFRQSFLHFNKFVRENMEKRERAAKKTVEDRALREKRTAEVAKLAQKLETAYDTKKRLDILLKKHFIFEDYLQAVVRASTLDFKTVDNILNRYETLIEAKKKLAERQEMGLSELENYRQKMVKMETENTLQILGLNNILAALEERYKRVNEVTKSEESLVEKIKNASVTAQAEIGSVKASILNMYYSMCERKKIEATISPDDSENLLMFIKKSVQEIVRARKLMEKKLRKTMSLQSQ